MQSTKWYFSICKVKISSLKYFNFNLYGLKISKVNSEPVEVEVEFVSQYPESIFRLDKKVFGYIDYAKSENEDHIQDG